MKPARKTLKTARVFVLFWAALIGIFTFIFIFPVFSKSLILGAAIGIAVVTSWKLAETYSDD
jgi:flagellar biosynthesis protein FliR